MVESVQMLGLFDFSTTTITERPPRDPLETRQRPEALVVPVLKARLPVTAVAAALPVLAALAEALLPMAWGAMVVLVDLAEMVFRANLGMALLVAWVAAAVTLYRGRQEVAATAETAVLAVLA